MDPVLASQHPEIARLRTGGWKMEEIADAIGASVRQVYRWSSGEYAPIRVYARALMALPTERSVAA